MSMIELIVGWLHVIDGYDVVVIIVKVWAIISGWWLMYVMLKLVGL